VNREVVLLPTALKFGLIGMTAGALLGEMVRKKARSLALGLLLGLLLAVGQTDARRTKGVR
jgi:hypothetical protein